MSATDITRKAIRDAFLELLNEKRIDKITVKDITERCGINRNTFYYHFKDIMGLLEEICSEEAERIILQYPELNSIEECMDTLMEFARANKRAAMHIYNSNNRSSYIEILWRVCEHVVSTYIETVFPDVQISEEDKSLIIRYYKCSCFGMIIDWISNGMSEEYAKGYKRVLSMNRGFADLVISNLTKPGEAL